MKNERGAFSLIELTIAFSIIIVLSLSCFFAHSPYVQSAKDVSKMKQKRQKETARALHWFENDGQVVKETETLNGNYLVPQDK